MTTVKDIEKYYRNLEKHLARRRRKGILWYDLPGMGEDKAWFNAKAHEDEETRRPVPWRG